MPEQSIARIRIYRQEQCWKILAYQYADAAKESGKDLRATW